MAMSTAERQRRHRQERQKQLAEKRASAREKDVTLIEGAVVATKDGAFSVYVWKGTELVEFGYGKVLDTA